jgi:hypothetical protein
MRAVLPPSPWAAAGRQTVAEETKKIPTRKMLVNIFLHLPIELSE